MEGEIMVGISYRHKTSQVLRWPGMMLDVLEM